MYQHLYSHFLNKHKGQKHFAAHSHYFWPDITKEAHMRYWDIAAESSDKKWDIIFGQEMPKAQKHIAKIINFSTPKWISFAPNTLELVMRLLSCLDKDLNVLSTSNEFHSFNRLSRRLSESDRFKLTLVNNEDKSFYENLKQQIKAQKFDMIYLSHVFFNSGQVLDLNKLEELLALIPDSTIVVLDAYHGFCALPTDIRAIEDRIFYLSGGYKYAQAGEGMCFMTVPQSHRDLRPIYTGWFADFENLSASSDKVAYAQSGYRFFGATTDYSAMFRFNNVWDQFNELGLSIEKINSYIKGNQQRVIDKTGDIWMLNKNIGHFLTINFDSYQPACAFYQKCQQANILCDFRNTRLRFGFSLYQTSDDIDYLINFINKNI